MKLATRPSRPDGDATRTRILEAAGVLYAAHGFSQITNKAVAALAQVDQASINYHFGSRDGLYQAVLAQAHRHLLDLEDLHRLLQSPVPAADKLRSLIAQLVANATSDEESWHLAVLAAEFMAPTPHVEVLLQSEAMPKLALIMPLLAEISGIAPGDPALLRSLVSVMAPCLLLMISRRAPAGPLKMVRNMQQEVLSEHLYQFAVAGLKAVGQAPEASGQQPPR